MLIQISDNRQKTGKLPFVISDPQSRQDIAEVADITLSALQEKFNDNFLLLPGQFDKSLDKIGDEYVCELSAKGVLSTGNILGFVGIGNTKLKVFSRFDSQDGNDYFLHFMLERVLQIHLMNMPFNFDDENIFDFLVYFFPMYLRRAMRQGLYREYQTYEHNDANVRGIIDFPAHIRKNLPFNGKIAYRTREYSSDNSVTELVRHTIEYISSREEWSSLLLSDPETKNAVSLITAATPSYSKGERNQIIAKNLRPSIHPFYSEYSPLQRLCVQILKHQEIKYGTDKHEVYGLLIDGAWLWEEYLAKLLPSDFVHPQNRLRTDGLTMIKGNSSYRVYPDFYIKDRIVLDAKYKRLGDKSNPFSEDMHQLVSYIKRLHAARGGLIFPAKGNSPIKEAHLENGLGILYALPLEIPQGCKTYSSFCQMMEANEQLLVSSIESIM